MIKNFKQYKAYLAGGALLLAGMAGAAQAGDVPKYGLPTAKPESVGMSTERLERIAPVMKRRVCQWILPGIWRVWNSVP